MARRTKRRRWSIMEGAVAFAIVGSLLATCIPPFLRDLHLSPLHEPQEGLPRLGELVLAYHAKHDTLPPSVPLTPASPARGTERIDPPGAWDHPTWLALGFKPVDDGVPHRFSFGYENLGESFVLEAQGDLDGDGITSRFQLRGVIENGKARLIDGLLVERELE